MADAPPDIFGFLDYRAFLEAWFDDRKARNPRFSHRLFARMAGQRSPSLLLSVIRRRRNLTPATAAAFAEAMRMDAGETSFFRALVDLDQAADDDARDEAWARIRAERRFRQARRVEGAAWSYLSSTLLPALRELVTLADFQEDPAWIGGKLRPPLRPDEAAEALDALFAIGMLSRDGSGRLIQTEASVVTPPEVGTLAVHAYHRDAAARARDAVRVPPDQRHLLGLTVAIPESLLPELKAQLNAVQARLLDLCDSAEGPRTRVMQLNLHLFPLTELT